MTSIRSAGIPVPAGYIDLEIYRLLTIFAASGELNRLARENHMSSELDHVVCCFEATEIGRILLVAAAAVRSDWDNHPGTTDDNLSLRGGEPAVGTLQPDLGAPQEQIPLRLRESLNKILHAGQFELQHDGGTAGSPGQLLPVVRLCGTKDGAAWAAKLDVFAWADAILHLT